MKIFLDTADIEAIRAWAPYGIIDGVTTNPTHLAHAGGNPIKRVQEICDALPGAFISVEVTEVTPEKVLAQAHAIAKIHASVVVKVPGALEYYGVIKELVADGIAVNVTLIFGLMQSIAMAKLGVRFISPFLGRLEDNGENPALFIEAVCDAFKHYAFKTEILAASLRNADHVLMAVCAGVDVITVSPALLHELLTHELTADGMQKFNADWKKLKVARFP
ncbi:MAG: transaldolase family protein [Candidatus Babeliales bacterium]